MPEVVEPEISYPCYVPHYDDGGIVCVAAGENENICICLFTDAKLLRAFWRHKLLRECDQGVDARDMGAAEYLSRDELRDDLESAEAELASQAVRYVAINPEGGQQVAYIAIRNFINRLGWR